MNYEQMTTEELFELYQADPKDEIKWAIVMRYTNMIKNVALQIRGVYCSFTQVEDIINEGLIVLARAVEKYDPSKGKFETYVSKRVRGMVIDLARQQDWIPRPIRRRAKEIEQANAELHTKLGRFPTDHEIAEHLHISDEEYYNIQSQSAVYNVVSLEELLEGNEQLPGSVGTAPTADSMPEQALEREELLASLSWAIGSLRENEQIVLSLYYQKDMKMKDIANVLGVSFARASQIHTRAIQKLKFLMTNEHKLGAKIPRIPRTPKNTKDRQANPDDNQDEEQE